MADIDLFLSQTLEIVHRWIAWAETDDPDAVRWRAFWRSDSSVKSADGIVLACFPVVRKTRCGAWIEREATWHGDHWHFWASSDPKFVYDGSLSAWAKPTRAEALKSLGIRLKRWGSRLRSDVERFNAACDVADALLSRARYAEGPSYAIFDDLFPASDMKIVVPGNREE